MREGVNPLKLNPQLEPFGRHRIIVPVYIPSLDGYFRHSLEILRLCLESLYLTTGERGKITVISNNSVKEVLHELEQFYQKGWIDQLIVNRKNWGKIDAVVAAARAVYEEIITISDSDVLFLPGWLESVEDAFYHFPEAGFISPSPSIGGHRYHATSTILGAMLKRELSCAKVVPEEDIDMFERSIGRRFKENHRALQIIVRRSNIIMCVGAGHFVFSVRRQVVQVFPKDPSLTAIGGAEELWLDLPPDRAGYWKLSTPQAYALHMGNVPEPWMYEKLEDIRRNTRCSLSRPPTLPPCRPEMIIRCIPLRLRNRISNFLIERIYTKILSKEF